MRVPHLIAAHSTMPWPYVSACVPDWKFFKFSVRATSENYLKKLQKGARQARSVFEDAMVAVTFAEAGQHDMVEQLQMQACDNLDRLIPEPERDGIDYHLTLKSGNPDEEIVRYVCDHRDVVLTIYDASGEQDAQEYLPEERRKAIPAIAQMLPTPLVLRRGGVSRLQSRP